MFKIDSYPINAVPCPGYDPVEFPEVKAVCYDGMPIGNEKTKVFAYIGFPEEKKDPVPGIVLIHGGGGHAYARWVDMWMKRGYAAIAMDTTGFYPDKDAENGWHYGLYGDFAEVGYTNAPTNDGMAEGVDPDVEKNWMYHAVADAMIARKILAQTPGVDASKIGVSGISWGGVITSILIGHDPEFAFAIPIYGSGYLGCDLTLGSIKRNFTPDSVQKRWLAEERFSNVKIPVLWLCWNDDNNFSIQANSRSYLDTAKGHPLTRLSIVDQMYHGHDVAWIRTESEIFADAAVSGKTLPGLEDYSEGRQISLNVCCENAYSVTCFYITDKMSYSVHDKFQYGAYTFMDQEWERMSCEVNGDLVTGMLPEEAAGYYIEIKTEVDGKEFIISSIYKEF